MEDLLGLETVEKADLVGVETASICSSTGMESLIRIHKPSCYSSNSLNIKTVDGKTIKDLKQNQIILNADSQSVVNEGETVTIGLTLFSEEDQEYIYTEFSVEVVGFVENDYLVIDDSVCSVPMSLSDMYSKMDEECMRWSSTTGLGVQSGIASKLMNADFDYVIGEESSQRIVVNLKKSVNPSDFISGLESINIDIEKVFSYDEIKNQYVLKYIDNIRTTNIYMAASISTALVLLLSFFANWMANKKNELIIYNLCGCPWDECIILSCIPYSLSIILGVLIGSIFVSLNSFSYLEIIKIPMSFYWILALAYLSIYVVISSIYCLIYRRFNAFERYEIKE